MPINLSQHYVSELAEYGLSQATIDTLLSNGISTIEDLAREMGRVDGGNKLDAVFKDDERHNLIVVSWRWMGRALKFGLKETD